MFLRYLVVVTLSSFLSVAVQSFAYTNIRQERSYKEDLYQMDSYIIPNENYFDAYARILGKRRGAYIGVGTFRIFNSVQYGNFDVVIGIDYQKGSVVFNKFILRCLLESSNRYEFLAMIFGKNFDSRMMRLMVRGKASKASFQKWLFSEKDLNQQASVIFGNEFGPRATFTYNRLRLGFDTISRKTPSAWNHSILGSDNAYAKAKQYAHDGKFIFIMGSLTGKNTMADTARFLRAKGIPVSVLDPSNALDPMDEVNRKVFMVNIERFTYSDDAIVLFTHSKSYYYFNPVGVGTPYASLLSVLDKSFDEFIYFGAPISGYLKILANKSVLPDDVNGVGPNTGTKILFPKLKDLSICTRILAF